MRGEVGGVIGGVELEFNVMRELHLCIFIVHRETISLMPDIGFIVVLVTNRGGYTLSPVVAYIDSIVRNG